MPSYLSQMDQSAFRDNVKAATADLLGPGSGCRFESFGLLAGQGQGVVRNGGWTCDLGNWSMPDAVKAI